MQELKRTKSALQSMEENSESRGLEAVVAEMAGLLKELVSDVRSYAESESKEDRERLTEVVRGVQDTYR